MLNTTVTATYFDAVDKLDLDGVLSLFTPDAVVTIRSAHAVHDGRDKDIGRWTWS